MDKHGAPSGIPIQFRGNRYKVLEWSLQSGEASVKIEPDNRELVKILESRIVRDEGLRTRLKFGYCEIEESE